MTSPFNNRQPTQSTLGLQETGPVATVSEYTFEPIRGYPMLQWAGKRPFRSTHFYPAQHKETYGPEVDGWRNKLYWGDNLQVMGHLLKNYRGQVQLIYIDPPFDSKADYTRKITVRGQSAQSDKSAFEDKQYTDIWTNDEYLQFMYERLILMRELLADDGTVYLHCDPARNSYLRLILDEVFGPESFVNEIVWKRSDAHNDVGQGARFYGRIHDTILVYGNPDKRVWQTIFLPLPDSTVDKWYRNVEEGTGRRFNKADLTARKPGGDTSFAWKGVTPPQGRYWAYSRARLEELEAQGRIVYSSSGMPYMKRYLDESRGVPLQDWWDDISMLRGIRQGERTGYPTEKPEALLERIIRASSNPGDLVFDCFMGSGTTQAVAMKLGRRFLGADINLGAVQITTKRLLTVAADLQAQATPKPSQPALLPATEGEADESAAEGQPATHYTGVEVYNVNNYDVFRNPVQARDLLIEALELEPFPAGSLYDGQRDDRMWKIMPVNRIATREDLESITHTYDPHIYDRRQAEAPNKPVEKITLVCMGHEPDLGLHLRNQMQPYKLDVEVLDILRDRQDIQFKRDSVAQITIRDGVLIIEQFWPMTLLSKLSQQREDVTEWRELVDSVMIDWNYDGAVLEPSVVDVPPEGQFVAGRYPVPSTAGTIRVKITDLLSQSLELEVAPHA